MLLAAATTLAVLTILPINHANNTLGFLATSFNLASYGLQTYPACKLHHPVYALAIQLGLVLLTCFHTSLALEEQMITAMTLFDLALRASDYGSACMQACAPTPSSTLVDHRGGSSILRTLSLATTPPLRYATSDDEDVFEEVEAGHEAMMAALSEHKTSVFGRWGACLNVTIVMSSLLALLDPAIIAAAFELSGWCLVFMVLLQFVTDIRLLGGMVVSCTAVPLFAHPTACARNHCRRCTLPWSLYFHNCGLGVAGACAGWHPRFVRSITAFCVDPSFGCSVKLALV
jgi:hypothetical protein